MRNHVRLYAAAAAVLCIAVSGFGRQWWSADTLARAGIKGGVSWAGLSNSSGLLPGVDKDPNFFFTVSAWTSHDFPKHHCALQSEIVFIRGGQKWEQGGNRITLDLDYLQMPVFLKLYFPMSAFVPNIYVGPFLSYSYRAAAKGLPGTPPGTPFFNSLYVTPAPSSDIDFARNPFDIGFVAGVGFRVPLGHVNWDLDFRYDYGALNAFSFPAGSEVRNYMFQLMTGISVNLKPKCDCVRVHSKKE